MAGLVRGAGVTSWSVEQSQRDAFVLRLTDNLVSAAFHYSKARACWRRLDMTQLQGGR